MSSHKAWCLAVFAVLTIHACPARALDRPWISDVFFYWYTWDYAKQWGGWEGGVYNTPLYGYYDSRSYEDNLRSLRTASEWGMTHHFMDFWGHNWKDNEGNPREQTLMRAAEALRDEGYDIFMSYYQDGTDFDMEDFAANMDEGRDTWDGIVHYASSPAWPKLHGKPMLLVYSRNGAPKFTKDDEGFRRAMKDKYGTIEALNRAWSTRYTDFGQVRLNFSAGPHRPDAVKYQLSRWRQKWQRLNERVQQATGLPGVVVSFDVGYRPYNGFGYSALAKTFAGPHSYGGIFGKPEEQDVQRFCQSVVAKYYDTVFFDHLKNFYNDWNIRIPGTSYPAEPCSFDRFWCGDLLRYNEAVLHMSWNEWWEGSNLEPCKEYGKTYCEKNLLWSSIMQQCFPSIHNFGEGAKVAILLNDYLWLAGGRHPEDVYGCVQTLRRLSLRFDLIPDDFVTQEKLERFQVVIAPSGGVGLGENAEGQSIERLLQEWVKKKADRRLVISGYPAFARQLSLRELKPSKGGAAAPGPDMNFFIDVGTDQDGDYLIEGAASREDWGKLPKGNFGASPESYTVRWTPAWGTTSTWLLPSSPGREHILRLSGSAIWENRATVRVNGIDVGALDIQPGAHEYEVTIPARAIGDCNMSCIELVYRDSRIPGELDSKKYPGESRVCNLAIDWIQFATAGTPFSREQNPPPRIRQIVFDSSAPGRLRNRRLSPPASIHPRLSDRRGTIISRYQPDGVPRDIVLPSGRGKIWYVNGLIGSIQDDLYLDGILSDWCGLRPEVSIRGDNVIGASLYSGTTKVLLAYNYDSSQRAKVRFRVPAQRQQISEVTAISRDGETFTPIKYRVDAGDVEFEDTLRYYGAYQVVFCPVKLRLPKPVVHPGAIQSLEIELKNSLERPVSGEVKLITHFPTLEGKPVKFSLQQWERKSVTMKLTALPNLDWGRKTVIFEVVTGGRHAFVWRPLTVERPCDLHLASQIVDYRNPAVEITNTASPYAPTTDAEKIRLTVDGQTTETGPLPAGKTIKTAINLALDATSKPALVTKMVEMSYTAGALSGLRVEPVLVAAYPTHFPRVEGAIAPVLICNPYDYFLENVPVAVSMSDLPGRGGAPNESSGDTPLHVRDAQGRILASQWLRNSDSTTLLVSAMLPPKATQLVYLCRGAAAPEPTDLRLDATDLGSGTGKITVANSCISATFSERQGASLAKLVSRATGRDYAKRGCLGVTYGSWGKYDPEHPSISGADFIARERKVYSAETPGRIEVLSSGPLSITLRASWADKAVESETLYTFYAYCPYFTIRRTVKPRRNLSCDELVALDVRLDSEYFKKIYPDFTGIPSTFDNPNPHHGWRESPYVPPVATALDPLAFAESVSVILQEQSGLDKYRQGFWPAQRPKPGPCKQAEMEYISTDGSAVSLTASFLIHPGHQAKAERFRKQLLSPPVAILPRVEDWLPVLRTGAESEPNAPADWWNPYWRYRVLLSPPAGGWSPGRAVRVNLEKAIILPALNGDALDPGSWRVVGRATPASTPVVIPAVQADSSTSQSTSILFSVPAEFPNGTEGKIWVYFDSLSNGPKAPLPSMTAAAGARLANGDFEKGTLFWEWANAELTSKDAHQGGQAAHLQQTSTEGYSLIANRSLPIVPEGLYRLRLWAKTDVPGLKLHANLYASGKFDFPHVSLPLSGDGAWHRYELYLTTGEFPPSIRPALRLWLAGQVGDVMVDDVELAFSKDRTENARAVARALEVQSR